MHVIFVDNGRTEVLASECRDILRCIRCGACLNVCPVYRQASGHAYRSVYPGRSGAVLSPLLMGERFPQKADLPKASSLCARATSLSRQHSHPRSLLRLRNRARRRTCRRRHAADGRVGLLASQPAAWRAALAGGK
jgi:L-lactate dehydrogenase complex protein LldF